MKNFIIPLLLVATSTFAQNPLTTDQWTTDIQQYQKTITEKHKNPFTVISKADFNAACDALISSLPDKNPEQTTVELCRIAASIGDSHTGISYRAQHLYPYSFYWFADGLKVIWIHRDNRTLLGGSLVSIDGLPAADVIKRIKSMIPHENDAQLKLHIPNYLTHAEALFGLGITKSKSGGTFVFKATDGTEHSLELKPVSMAQMGMFRNNLAMVQPRKPMLANENATKIYWFKTLEEQNAVYVSYKTCREDRNYAFNQFVKDIMTQLDHMDQPKLIIDLRANGGGNSAIFAPMLKAIKDRPGLNKKGKLYVIIGRRTFSSAVLNAMDLRNETEAILVGEPTGGKPNHFGEVKNDRLTNSGLRFTWSVKYFTVTDGDPASIFPDVDVRNTIDDYRAGNDVVLKEIFEAASRR